MVDSAPLPPPPSDGVAVADVVDGKVAAEEETALEETALEEMENEEPIDGGMMM